MNLYLKFTISLLLFFSLIFCNPQKRISQNYDRQIECLGTEMDGSVTVKAFGKGSNRKDALDQAKKNAVNAIIFKGLISGKSNCGSIPLVLTSNARLKFQEYFNKFFADGGDYNKYVSFKDERAGLKALRGRKDFSIRVNTREFVSQNIVLRVEKYKLRKKLLKDKIITE